jgi:mRNA-degrading endonuclease RelE of RelBE toxin-antitoxin system
VAYGIETPIFTKRITALLSDEQYRSIQNDLSEQPKKGPVIKGSKGLRKLRCAIPGKGKRGGARIIYYWFTEDDQIYMLLAYKKNEAEDLTKDQIKALSKIVEDELYEKK